MELRVKLAMTALKSHGIICNTQIASHTEWASSRLAIIFCWLLVKKLVLG